MTELKPGAIWVSGSSEVDSIEREEPSWSSSSNIVSYDEEYDLEPSVTVATEVYDDEDINNNTSGLSPSEREQKRLDTELEDQNRSIHADPVEKKKSLTSYELKRAGKQNRRRRLYAAAGIMLCLLIIIVVVLAVVFSMRNKKGVTEQVMVAPTTSPVGKIDEITGAPSPTSAPTSFGDNVFDNSDPGAPPPVVLNDNCMGALMIPWPDKDNGLNVSNDAVSSSTGEGNAVAAATGTVAGSMAPEAAVAITGTTADATMELQGLRTCGMVHLNGRGVWFTLEVPEGAEGGDGDNEDSGVRRIVASTCNKTRYDSQISVYSGMSCGDERSVRNLACVAGNDQSAVSSVSSSCGNGDQSRLVFLAERGTTYYILVHGYRSAVGDFELQLAEMPLENDLCETAMLFQWEANTLTSSFGSTLGATPDDTNDIVMGECGSVSGGSNPGPGIWYRLNGDGLFSRTQVSVKTEHTGFETVELLVFQAVLNPTAGLPSVGGGSTSFLPESDTPEELCASLECVGGQMGDGATVSFEPSSDHVYFILVRGTSADTTGERGGDFELQVGESISFSPPPPPNDECSGAFPLLPIPIDNARDETTWASFDGNVKSCGQLVFITSPGVWYTIPPLPIREGTRLPVTATVCADPMTLVAARLSIFQGSKNSSLSGCETLTCVDGNEPVAPVMSRDNETAPFDTSSFCEIEGHEPALMTWFLEAGRSYFLMVHGYGSHVGHYDLSFEYTTLQVGKQCNTGVEIQIPHDLGRSILGFVEHLTGDLETAPTCWKNATKGTNEYFQTGSWFQLVGMGQSLVASTCHPSTAPGIQLLVLASAGESMVGVSGVSGCNDSDGLRCVVNTTETFCQDEQMAISWYAVADQVYYLLVYDTADDGEAAAAAQDEGRQFVLTVDEVATNEFCIGAIGPLSSSLAPLDTFDSNGDAAVARSTTFGSTRATATLHDRRDLCSDVFLEEGDDVQPSRGLWYSVEGTGTNMVASTCSDFTNFESHISVFLWTGGGDNTVSNATTTTETTNVEDVLEGCNTKTFLSSFECVGTYRSGNDTTNTTLNLEDITGCPWTSTVTWESSAGAVYLLLVQGRTELEFGNFGLRILHVTRE